MAIPWVKKRPSEHLRERVRFTTQPALDAPNERFLQNLVDDVVVGAMGAQNAMRFFKRGVLLITPGDREDTHAAPG